MSGEIRSSHKTVKISVKSNILLLCCWIVKCNRKLDQIGFCDPCFCESCVVAVSCHKCSLNSYESTLVDEMCHIGTSYEVLVSLVEKIYAYFDRCPYNPDWFFLHKNVTLFWGVEKLSCGLRFELKGYRWASWYTKVFSTTKISSL